MCAEISERESPNRCRRKTRWVTLNRRIKAFIRKSTEGKPWQCLTRCMRVNGKAAPEFEVGKLIAPGSHHFTMGHEVFKVRDGRIAWVIYTS